MMRTVVQKMKTKSENEVNQLEIKKFMFNLYAYSFRFINLEEYSFNTDNWFQWFESSSKFTVLVVAVFTKKENRKRQSQQAM